MKTLLSLLAASTLALGAICITGCQPNSPSQQAHHDELFGGGPGGFGETPAIAGDYPNDVRHDQVSDSNK